MPTLPTSTVRVTRSDGVPCQGTVAPVRRSVCDPVRRRDAGPPAPRGDPPSHPAAEGEALVAARCRVVACSEDPLGIATASTAEAAP